MERRRDVARSAVQNRWSVSQMRSSRWLAMVVPDELRPRDSDVITAELDEDFSPDQSGAPSAAADRPTAEFAGTTGPDFNQGPDFGDDGHQAADSDDAGVPFDAGGQAYPGDVAAELRPDRSRTCPSCPPTWPTRSRVSSWPSCGTKSPAGSTSPATTCWPASTRCALSPARIVNRDTRRPRSTSGLAPGQARVLTKIVSAFWRRQSRQSDREFACRTLSPAAVRDVGGVVAGWARSL